MKMSADFLTRLQKSAVLCDGAMGTLLYSKGIFINRCYDELNLSQPDLIRGVHREYLQAGAEIIETNTFGGNSFRLARHSMADRVHEVNLAGARLAREAAKSFDGWVGGSVGPVAMLAAIERVRAVTSLPLAAQPNAGIPRSVEGRNIYLCSPEYMASYARKFVTAGVRLVGGCCGTTPDHIRVMKSALRAGEARSKTAVAQVKSGTGPVPIPAVPMEQRSRLGQKLANGDFVTMVEIVPPKGTDIHKELDGARFLKSVGVDGINIPDSPRASARMSNQALSLLVQREAGIEAVLHYTCRDRNVLCIQSDLLGAAATGIRNLICITGDPPKMGNYPDATAVFDVDAIGLVNIVHNLNRGLDIGGNPIGAGTDFVIGVGANPGVPNLDEEVRRFEYKVEAGGEYAVTQPVFDLSLLENFLRRIEHCRIPVVAGIWPLVSVRNAEFMQNELRVSVPDSILERMAKAKNPEAAREEGIAIAREMLTAVRDLVQGAQISAPLGRYASAVDVLEALGTARPAASV